MTKKANPVHDFRGAGRLTVDAIKGIVDMVESVHSTILNLGGLLGRKGENKTSGITGMVYQNIRSTTDLVAKGLDSLTDKLAPLINDKESTPEREAALSVLNGVMGDYLEEKQNPLAIQMRFRMDGKSIHFDDKRLVQSIDACNGRLVLLIHGSCMNDLQWNREGHDHGKSVEQDFGYLPVYLHYNSGRHVSSNGRELAGQIDLLLSEISGIRELVIIAHSMGGLVIRSAMHYGKIAHYPWPDRVKKVVFLGTPHHGAPLERAGNWIDNMLEKSPYSKPFSKLGKIRSSGITDLRYGNVVDEDWENHDRFEHVGDRRIPVPLPLEVECFTIAATMGLVSGKLGNDLIGDGLVPLNSALGKHKNPELNLSFPESNQWVGYNMKHLDLLNHPEVYTVIKKWLY